MKKGLTILFLLLPIPVFLLSLIAGTYNIQFSNILDPSSPGAMILFKIRLPRTLAAMLVGATLSVSGAVLQSTFKNPLVDSYILGISSGAAFGAALATFLQVKAITPFAFIFSLLAVSITYSFAKISGRITPISLVLSGIVVTAFFQATTSLLELFMEQSQLAGIVYWLMGSFANASWNSLKFTTPVVVICMILIFKMRWQLNVLSLGEEAETLGIKPDTLRFIFIVIVSIMTASVVAHFGVIGWVGLIIPHIVRMAIGPDHRTLIPTSITFGAALVCLVDALSRTFSPVEIPIGTLTTVAGVPFFLFLLKRTGGRWYGS